MIFCDFLGQLVVSVGELLPEIVQALLFCVAAGKSAGVVGVLPDVDDEILDLLGQVRLAFDELGGLAFVFGGHREVGEHSLTVGHVHAERTDAATRFQARTLTLMRAHGLGRGHSSVGTDTDTGDP